MAIYDYVQLIITIYIYAHVINAIKRKIVCNDFSFTPRIYPQLSVIRFCGWHTPKVTVAFNWDYKIVIAHSLTPVYVGSELFVTCGSDRNILCAVYTGR